MPVKIPDDLPAYSVLQSENIFVMSMQRAETQDIRPLKILILNLMPTKVETEIQLLRCLGNSPLQTDVTFLQAATHESKNTSREYLGRFYRTFDEIRNEKFDGMIITGAPVETIDFEEVDYWDELCGIMDWCKTNVCSTLYICWGAQAGLYYHYGITKYDLDSKISGIFEHKLLVKDEGITKGFDDRFFMPQSRHTQVSQELIKENPHLHVIADSWETGAGIIVDERNQVFITGHFEYESSTLAYEYERDLAAGKEPHVPDNYFEDNDPSKDPVVRWRGHATLFFTNWLNYNVYQKTPYNIEDIGKDIRWPNQ
jgi:homoserine O-succinyltransferase